MSTSSSPARTRECVTLDSDEHETWSIGIYSGATLLDLEPHSAIRNPILTRRDVTDVDAVCVADPFMIREGATSYLFFEVLERTEQRGEIGLAVSDDGLHWRYRQIVLKEKWHLSYPYVFKWENAHYMVPESRRAGRIVLYQAALFPLDWRPVATIRRGNFADPSIFRFRGQWWMFVCSSWCDTLRLYMTEDLKSPWREHPLSPLVDGDPGRARPAGRVVACDDHVVRFAQNCRQRYGMAVRAYKINRLTPTEYAEKELARVPILRGSGQGWNAQRMHHIDPHPTSEGSWIAYVDGRPS